MEILKQSLLDTQKRKSSNLDKEEDFCLVCNYNLYFNKKVTTRIGFFDSKENITGWLCPNCKSEFNLKNKVVELFGDDIPKGEA